MKEGIGLVMKKLGVCTAAPRFSSIAVKEEKLIRVYGLLWCCDEGLLRRSEPYHLPSGIGWINTFTRKHTYRTAWKPIYLLKGLGNETLTA